MSTKCADCTNDATGILETYYHDGGTLTVTPLCDDCGANCPTEFEYPDDRDERPDSVFWRVGIEKADRFFDLANRDRYYLGAAWNRIGRSGWAPHEYTESE